ncbi:enoyl-CoA hydratase-related protein [Nitratifractor sp.]|uniref:enoyl-CoA hydratase-related protein n=1 Tax=Nitratifractor sp. TaxID=2268144 RepID=UPI0025D9047A|nr:enoyl-CoA hydratase-related protein [Nitratifractor sp.]
MRIALLVSAFNSLSQAVFCRLADMGHEVCVVYAIHPEQIRQELLEHNPEIVLAPYLLRYIPPEVYTLRPTYIFHPGPRGDRGPDSLEHALSRSEGKWGAVWLEAAEALDSGDILAEAAFEIRPGATKASIYRQEVTQAAAALLPTLLAAHESGQRTSQIEAPMHARFTQKERSIDWERDDTETIIKKINLSDSLPGVLDEIAGMPCYLFGAHEEERLGAEFADAPIKTVLAKRNGAICLKTRDGAVWNSHLKEPHRFKLPATYVLKDRIAGVKERRIPLIFDRSYETFHEIWAEEEEGIAYLHFDFHNGAMSSDQCIRLKYAFDYLKERCEVLVLMGGNEFFSNGIHLNILEDSKKQGEDGWSNINAMNDLIASILYAEEVLTVASFGRNAGAGGVFLGMACDLVVAREGVVLNPHYKTLGLSGSEYHTYTLPHRIGEEAAETLLDACLPLGAQKAHAIGMIDQLLPPEEYEKALKVYCRSLRDDEDRFYDLLDAKVDRLSEEKGTMDAAKRKELEIMHPEFWDPNSSFHTLRREFVYKLCPTKTPERFKQCMNTR